MARRSSNEFASLSAAEQLAQRRLPKTLFKRIRSGAGNDSTHQQNVAAFKDVLFRPRAATAFASRDQSLDLLGHQLSTPVLLAPTGGVRLVHPDGELGAARAAGAAGTAYAASMFAGFSIEEIGAAGDGPKYQQLYMTLGRAHAEDVIARADAAGYAALVVTVDIAVLPHAADKHPLKVDLRNALTWGPELVQRPTWFYRFVRDGMPFDAGSAMKASEDTQSAVMTATWEDFSWIREQWRGPLIIKGIITGDDAVRAADVGADAIVVSNHGGKGLDTTKATLRALPEVVKAVGGGIDVLLDGGVRSGADVVKALALGAKAVLVGRPYIWGLAVDGERGVARVLEILKSEIDRTLGLLGCESIAGLDQSYVEPLGGRP